MKKNSWMSGVLALCLVLSLSLVACKDKDKKTTGSSSASKSKKARSKPKSRKTPNYGSGAAAPIGSGPTAQPSGVPSPLPPKASLTKLEQLKQDIQGSWKKSCSLHPQLGVYVIHKIEIDDDKIHEGVTMYSSSSCGRRLQTATTEFSVELTETVLTKIALGGSLTPHDGVASQLNAISHCGITNWQDDVARDVTTCSTAGFSGLIGMKFPKPVQVISNFSLTLGDEIFYKF